MGSPVAGGGPTLTRDGGLAHSPGAGLPCSLVPSHRANPLGLHLPLHPLGSNRLQPLSLHSTLALTTCTDIAFYGSAMVCPAPRLTAAPETQPGGCFWREGLRAEPCAFVRKSSVAAPGLHVGEKWFHQEPDTKGTDTSMATCRSSLRTLFPVFARFLPSLGMLFPAPSARPMPFHPQLPGSGRSPVGTPTLMDFTQGGLQVCSPPPIAWGRVGTGRRQVCHYEPRLTAHPTWKRVLNTNLCSPQTNPALKNPICTPSAQRKEAPRLAGAEGTGRKEPAAEEPRPSREPGSAPRQSKALWPRAGLASHPSDGV